MKKLLLSLTEIRAQLFAGKLALGLILVLSVIGHANAQVNNTSPLDVSNLSFTPAVIDTSNNSQVVSVNIRVTNVITNVTCVRVGFRSLTGNQVVFFTMKSQHLISGNARDGVYQGEAIFPQDSKAGHWQVFQIIAFDTFNYRNFYNSDIAARNFPIELQVISINEDITPPEIIDFSFTPSAVDTTNNSQNVAVTVRATDVQAGVRTLDVTFRRPNEDALLPVTMNLVSGDNKDGIYKGVITLPRNTNSGMYQISVHSSDMLGNPKSLYTEDLAKLGFAAELQIIGTGIKSETGRKTRKRTLFFQQ